MLSTRISGPGTIVQSRNDLTEYSTATTNVPVFKFSATTISLNKYNLQSIHKHETKRNEEPTPLKKRIAARLATSNPLDLLTTTSSSITRFKNTCCDTSAIVKYFEYSTSYNSSSSPQ